MVYGLTRGLIAANAMDQDLGDGMLIASALPMTVNTVIILTKSAGGDEACAIVNASFGNILGIFVTPALVLLYIGETSKIEFGPLVLKLCYRVLIPLIVGQILQFFCPPIVKFVTKYKSKISICQEWAMA